MRDTDCTLGSHAVALEVLERLWRRGAVTGWDHASGPELREVALQLNAYARENALRPEQLIVLIKRSWMSAAGPCAAPERRVAHEVLDDVVTACISSFFEQPRTRTDSHDSRPTSTI